MRLERLPLPEAAWRGVLGRLRGTFLKWDADVDGRSRVPPMALVLSADEHRECVRAAEAIAAASLRQQQAWHRAGGPALPHGLQSLAAAGAPGPFVTRVDLFATPDGWRASECNDDVPGGYNEAIGLPALLEPHLPDGLEVPGDLPDALARLVGAGPGARIGITFATGYAEDLQVAELLARLWEAHGAHVALGSPAQLEAVPGDASGGGGNEGGSGGWSRGGAADRGDGPRGADVVRGAHGAHGASGAGGADGGDGDDGRAAGDGARGVDVRGAGVALRLAGEPVDRVFRFFPTEWHAALPNLRAWHLAARAGAVTNPFATAWTQHKGAFEAMAAAGGPAARHLPATHDAAAALHEALDDPARWVLKPAFGRMGEGVVCGDLVTAHAWRKRLAEATRSRDRPFVLQERFRPVPLEAAPGVTRVACVGAYVVGGRFAGYYSRLAPGAVVAYHAENVLTVVEGA